jgi:DNA invertase Pin-like site-specific DNA recombinase
MLPAEPIYQGLPLSAYLSSSAQNEQKAREALQQFGDQAGVAVSAVTNALANADGITRPALEQALRAIGGSSNAP